LGISTKWSLESTIPQSKKKESKNSLFPLDAFELCHQISVAPKVCKLIISTMVTCCHVMVKLSPAVVTFLIILAYEIIYVIFIY
jgi:hypothetical protein